MRPYGVVVSVGRVESRWLAGLPVAAVVAVPTVADAWWNAPGTRPADGWTYLLVSMSLLALWWRLRWPGSAVVVCGAAWTALAWRGHHGELLFLPSAVALYTVAAGGDRRRNLVWGALAVGCCGVVAWVAGGRVSAPVTEMLWPLAAVALGEAARSRRELSAEYAARQVRADAEQRSRAEQRVQQERLRIAREFHDVVAHTLTAVNVHLTVATAAFHGRPETARAALEQARMSGRAAVQELRAAVVLLREAGPDAPAPPSPGLAQLDGLVERVRAVGVRVSVQCATDDGRLPAGVELTAYRIVQEALTNVVRHAAAQTAAVSVRTTEDALVVEVTDDGVGVGGVLSAGSGGHGLVGMAERAAAWGGRVSWGAGAGGGFRVYAVLPVAGERP